jgi:2-aminoethylphosphonate transport system permease protein
MLVWSPSGRFVVWLLAALLIGVIFIAPLAVILAASLAKQWNGVLPTGFTLEHYAAAGSGASGDAVLASLVTGLVASLLACFRVVGGAGFALPRGGVGPNPGPPFLHS